VRRLVAQGALRLIQRSKAGHLLEVRVPEEIRREKQNAIENRTGGEDEGGAGATINIEEADFLQNTTLRKAIHARERGHPSIKRPRQLRQEEISSASFGWPCRVSDQRTDPKISGRL